MRAPNELSALEAAQHIATGTLSSEELVRACLDRIAAREPDVQAWTYLDPRHAIEQARARDRSPSKGLLHGLPVGIKDVLDTCDMPTVWGDESIYAHRRPERDAPVVQRLREEGAVLLGKTVLSRLGFSTPGKTRNPHDLTRTPGASSSGSAAAVADRMCPLALGTQTVGSVLRPAAFCGVVGVKPTHDWIAWRHSHDCAPSLDVVGGVGRSVQDICLLMHGISGRPDFDPRAPYDQPVRVGVYRTADWSCAPDYTRAAYEETVDRLARFGCDVHEVRLSPAYDRLSEVIDVIYAYECARSFAWEHERHRDKLEAEALALLETGLSCSRARYLEALAHAERCQMSFGADMGEVDLLVVPGALGEAPEADDTGSNEFIAMWTALHVPAVSLPVAKGPSGLPLAVQLIGRRGDDAMHLRRAAGIEALLRADGGGGL